jgi:hypothetical protein|nr:MAG TPA: hemolysin [Bacteriophage sp.]
MVDDTLQEVRERLIKIEVLLENMSKNNELKNEILEEKIKVANNRISDLENSNTWLWRAIAGSLISAVVALLL